MAGPPTFSDAMLILEWQGANQTYPGATTLGVQAGTITSATLGDLGSAVQDFVEQTFSVDITDASVSLKVGPVATGPTFFIRDQMAGTWSGASSSPQTALLIRKERLNASGRLWGRMYLPAPPESAVADRGLLETGALTRVDNACIEFFDALVALDFSPQIYYQNSSDPAPVTALSVQPRVATQRRRLRR